MRRNGSKLDDAAKARTQAEQVGLLVARIKQVRSRINDDLLQPGESMSDTSELPRTGLLLILVAVIDTVFEWHLWTHAGGVTLGLLVLSRLALLTYGARLLRHKRST
jgi:hypothetical protein